MRDGVLTYQCAVASACPGGTVQGFTSSHTIAAGRYGMSPAEFRRVDPTGIGASTLAARRTGSSSRCRTSTAVMRQHHGLPLHLADRERVQHDHRARRLPHQSGSQSLFTRFNSQDDAIVGAQQFPGRRRTRRARSRTGASRAATTGCSAPTWSTRCASATRRSTTRRSACRRRARTTFRFIDNFEALTSTNGACELGTRNITNDFSWIKGNHTLKFGTNLRWLRNDTFTNASSFFGGSANGSWVAGVGRRYMPGGACPAPADCSGLPAVASGGQAIYADSFINMLGAITQTTARYNYTIDGGVISEGTPLPRLYVANEYEFYVQDQWRVGDNFTLTGGLRYSLFPPVYEGRGQQVVPNVNLGDGSTRASQHGSAAFRRARTPTISFIPGGPVNDGPGWYQYDKNNFAPRVSFAWTLNSEDDRPRRLLPGLRPRRLRPRHAVQHRRLVRSGDVLSSPVNPTTRPTRRSASRAST